MSPASPRTRARRAGLLYLLSGVPAGFSVFVFMKLLVRNDPAATARSILDSEGLFRLGLSADLVGILIFVGAILILYELFQPVSRSVARLFLIFNLIGAGIQALDSLQDVAALMLLKGGATMAALPAGQSQALAYLFLRLHVMTYDLAFLFFGTGIVMLSLLLLRSTFLPRILGPVALIDGAGYLTFSLANFLAPAFAVHLYPFLPFATAIIGEASVVLWLIVKGVDSRKWEEQAAAESART